MREIASCLYCCNREFEYRFTGRDKNENIRRHYRYVRCRRCGLIFLNPQPEERELALHYPPERYYAFREIDETSVETHMRRFLYHLYFSQGDKRRLLRGLLQPVKVLSRSTLVEPGLKLLDVGCGSGQFVAEMLGFGMDAYGVDPNCSVRDAPDALRPRIFPGNLPEAGFAPESFDVITMNHVVEHLPNPREVLAETFRILKKNGTFIIGVPNCRSFAFRLFGRNWYQIDTPRHLVVYSDKILAGMLRAAGFRITKTRFYSGPRQFSFSLANALNMPWLRKIVLALDIFFWLLIYPINFFRQGDQCEIFCTKESGGGR